jgi:DNA invertase Pin-like site-specific DNA recombinase
MFQMMGVFAKFERSMIRERVLAGMSRAAAQGTRSGKPIGRPRIEPEMEASIRAALTKGGMGMRKIAVQLGVATGTVQRIARVLGASVAA